MISDIDVSVIVPVYNAGELLDRCLDSIFGQATDRTVEVILVDDGSTDNSVELIRRRPEQDRIRLFQQANSGPSKARNKGIAEARGRYLAFLDADDYWLQGFIDSTAGFLDRHPECVAVSVAQQHITLGGGGESPRDWNIITQGDQVVLGDFYEFWGHHRHICTGSIMMRSNIARNLGGMREDLRSCEDLEFWALLASKGSMGFIPRILFVSDGTKVTAAMGWAKYKARFKATVGFETWFDRLAKILTPEQKKSAVNLFNSVVLGISRSFICGGKFKAAYSNMSNYVNRNSNEHYMLEIASKGKIVWYMFCVIYLSYRYCKINLPYWRQKLGV